MQAPRPGGPKPEPKPKPEPEPKLEPKPKLEPELRRAAARALAACAACVGTATSFFMVSVAAWPVPRYFPLARRWAMSPRPLELSMDYYGRSLYALLGGIAAGLVVYACAQRWLPSPGANDDNDSDKAADAAAASPSSDAEAGRAAPAARGRAGFGLWLALLYALTALLLTAALFAYQLWGRATFAEALAPASPGAAQRSASAPPSAEPPAPPTKTDEQE